MTDSIQVQLREYADQVTSQSVPVGLDQFGEPFPLPVLRTIGSGSEYSTEPVVFRRRRRWLVAASAVAAVLILVGGAAWLSGATSSESPVATTPRTDSLSLLMWSRVSHDEALFGDGFEQVMSQVISGGPGVVAVGQAGPGEDGEGRAAVWTSSDGITWVRVPHNDDVFARSAMSSVTVGGPGLVAVGASDYPVVWTSTDGVTWSRVPNDRAVFGGADAPYMAMNSVTAGGPGLVAVGIEGHPHGENVRAVVWTSPDGFAWSRVPHNEAVFGREGDGQYTEMSSVTVGGPGLVAVGGGWSGADGGKGGAAVWTSVDGFTWSRVPHDEAVFGGAAMAAVTVGGPGLVAVGGDGGSAAVWTSVDGFTWSRVPHDEAVFDTQEPDLPLLEMRSVTASGPRLVVVGANGVQPTFGATRSDAAVWIAVPAQ